MSVEVENEEDVWEEYWEAYDHADDIEREENYDRVIDTRRKRMLKGRYVALVEVDFKCEESQIEVDSEELNERFHGEWMEKTMATVIGKQMFAGVHGSVKVTRQYADLVEVGETDDTD